jgi:hypothetical protein
LQVRHFHDGAVDKPLHSRIGGEPEFSNAFLCRARVKDLTNCPGRQDGNAVASFYLIGKTAETTWLMICIPMRMTLVSARLVAGSISLACGICPVVGAGSLDNSSAYTLVPAQLSAGRTAPPNAPARKWMSGPAKPQGELTSGEQSRLVDAINRMTPKERKRLAKAMKRLTPEERAQLAQVLKRQLAGKGPVSQLAGHAR